MPRLVLIELLSCLSLTLALSQDSTPVVSTSLFTDRHPIRLSSLTGWVYQAGRDPAWAREKLNTTSWVKRQPGALSAQDAIVNGKA